MPNNQDPVQPNPLEAAKIPTKKGKKSKLLYVILALIGVFLIVAVGVGAYLLIDNLATEEDDETAGKVENTKIDDDLEDSYSREFVAEGVWGSVPAITVDDNDVPHVAFYGRQFGDLMYANKLSGKWEYETVDDEGDVGTEKGIAVASDGTVHIAYKDTTNGNTKYAVKSNGTWEVSVLEEVPDTHHTVFVDLELDSSGIPHVVYHTESNQGIDEDAYDMSTVKYAVLNGQAQLDGDTWDIERLAPCGQFTQLALDANDQPHILYVVEPEEQTIHAYKENGEWVYDEIDPEAGNRRDVDIDIDHDSGSVHIIYHDTDGGLIKYYRRDADGSETIETVDTGLSTTGLGYKGIKLGLDPEGIPHVIYFNETRNGLVHATKSAGEWVYEIIDAGGFPAVAVDSQSRVHVAYPYALEGSFELAPEVVERDEDNLEQIVYQLVE
jgi:hypothetical protein